MVRFSLKKMIQPQKAIQTQQQIFSRTNKYILVSHANLLSLARRTKIIATGRRDKSRFFLAAPAYPLRCLETGFSCAALATGVFWFHGSAMRVIGNGWTLRLKTKQSVSMSIGSYASFVVYGNERWGCVRKREKGIRTNYERVKGYRTNRIIYVINDSRVVTTLLSRMIRIGD